MQTHVYANNQEIACKAAGNDGVSPQAFPDPCWSPPGPAAGPIVIPYPNTCYASSITNGTSTVFICGKEIAIEDHSCFSTSTGNEPATKAFKKGVATGVITGKAYFTQWSFDVVFEGLGVPRHNDMVGHNHGSMPSNTPLFPYISRGWFSHDCKKEEQRIERACEAEDDHSDSRKDIKGKSKLSKLLKMTRKNDPKKGRREGGKAGWHWTDDHCDGLEIPLPTKEGAQAYAKQMEKIYQEIPGELDLLNALKSELQDMARNAATKAALKWGAKAAVKQGAGSALPAVGNAAMAIWSVADAAVAVGDVNEIRRVASESLDKLKVLKAKVTDMQRIASEFKDFSAMPDGEAKLNKSLGLATDGQDMLATLNDCTRARKCNLMPFQTDGVGRDSKVDAANKGGCCGGQTGHHLVPGGSVKDTCPGYNHNRAPTVCVEGTSQNHGSHKRAHEALAREHEALDQNGRVDSNGTMSMNDSLNAATESHQKAFPLSKCSKKCIRAQLDSYYQKCGNARAKMVNEQAKPAMPANTSGGSAD